MKGKTMVTALEKAQARNRKDAIRADIRLLKLISKSIIKAHAEATAARFNDPGPDYGERVIDGLQSALSTVTDLIMAKESALQ
jgi:hypothetical protein